MAVGNLEHALPRLQSQISRAEVVLFTGAGFSLSAKDSEGNSIPSSEQLTEEFWKIAFPSKEFPGDVRLGDAFHSAKVVNPKVLRDQIKRRLSVESETLPNYYKYWFSLPWFRCYTLNIDDLEQAVNIRYNLRRLVSSISATSDKYGELLNGSDLEVVHLNGTLGDDLDSLIFSATDYSNRRAGLDIWYRQCVTDIVSRPVVFVGTELDESPLWDYLAIRGDKGIRGLRELRPGSLLVGPSLNAARQLMLKELHVDWIPMTAEDFSQRCLEKFEEGAIDQGFQAIRIRRDNEKRSEHPSLVSDLASNSLDQQTEYLMGHEPEWSDLQAGRAIHRDFDNEIFNCANHTISSKEPQPPMILTGTAGSGKSTSLMRLGLRLAGRGIPTYWIDEGSNINPNGIRELITRDELPVAVLVDDADVFGRMASRWATELTMLRGKVLFVFAVRSSKVDSLLQDTQDSVKSTEFTMSNLTDNDINSLIEVLDKENRLGVLKGKSQKQRFQAFKQRANRQLLVAMIEATSGRRFDEKAVHEFVELTPSQKTLYGIICFGHSQRFSLSLDELLTAANAHDNETLNELDKLVNRNLVVRKDRYSGYRSRHRVVSERVVNSPEFRSVAPSVVEGVCISFGTHLRQGQNRMNRNWRRFIKFINHEFILLFCSVSDGRRVYGSVEGLLEWDYHYWLQRGSLEVQEGDLALAGNYIGQARSLVGYDPLVEAEWAYLLMKKASQQVGHTEAEEWFTEGFTILKRLIQSRGKFDSYPYHILGSQTISWSRSAKLTDLSRRNLLREVVDILEEGSIRHPKRMEIRQLNEDVKKEWLFTAVADSTASGL